MIHNRQDNFKRTVSNSRNVLKQRYQIREIIITSIVVAVILVLGIQVWHVHQQEVQLQNKIQTEQVHLKHEKEAEKNLTLNQHRLHNRKYVDALLTKRFSYTKSGETAYRLPGDVSKDVTKK